MKNILFMVFSTAFLSLCYGQNAAIEYDTLALHSDLGMYFDSLFETIRDENSLNEYYLKIGYDTLQVSKKPDFDSEMVVSVVIQFFRGDYGNIGYYRRIDSITERNDSIFVDIHSDSTVYDSGLKIQHSFSILMIKIPRSEKSVVFRVENPTSVRKQGESEFKRKNSAKIPAGTKQYYDIGGRLLKNDNIHGNRIFVSTTPGYTKKYVFFRKKCAEIK